jgi:ABC-2 type transport system ATP-binding protein
MIRRLSEQGITMLVSSHLLSELAQVATRYAIIHHGKLVREFSQDELRLECKRALAAKVDDAAKAIMILETGLDIRDYKQVSVNELRIYEYLHDPAEVTFRLTAGGVRVSSLYEVGDSLEDYYAKIIGGESK